MTAARKLETIADTPEARLARLRALPRRPEAPTEEERAMFREMEEEVRTRAPAVPTADIWATIDEMRSDAGE
jgi:hypothetical protein